MTGIVEYTDNEGGQWLHCDWTLPAPHILENLKLEANHQKNNFIMLGNVEVHSFRCDDEREWDVVNGWRTKRTRS